MVITEGVSEVDVETAASLLVEGGSGGREVEEVEDGGSEDEEDEAGEEVEGVRTSELDVDLQVGLEWRRT